MGTEPTGAPPFIGVIVLFGPNAVGKTTLATAIAETLPRAALIEVDALRYQRRGGLVAMEPRFVTRAEHHSEYRRQCQEADELAAMQARYYVALGISVCVEGLEDDALPGSELGDERLGTACAVHHLLVQCSEDTARARLAGRGMEFTQERRTEHARWRALAPRFDQVVSTRRREHLPVALAKALVARLVS